MGVTVHFARSVFLVDDLLQARQIEEIVISGGRDHYIRQPGLVDADIIGIPKIDVGFVLGDNLLNLR